MLATGPFVPGITTGVIGALQRGLGPLQAELGIHVCGGRGQHSRKTPDELRLPARALAFRLGDPHQAAGENAATQLHSAFVGSCAVTKVTPIRFCWIHAILHSRIEESFAITRRKLAGTKAGFSTSMAAPSGEIFRTTQLITDPLDDT